MDSPDTGQHGKTQFGLTPISYQKYSALVEHGYCRLALWGIERTMAFSQYRKVMCVL